MYSLGDPATVGKWEGVVCHGMKHPRPAYELRKSQVSTPPAVVQLFWRLVKQYRRHLKSVLDMGAGDCRFAEGGSYDEYVGVEIDRTRAASALPPTNGRVIQGCVFRHSGSDYSACIGNPPYVRHHDVRSPWKEKTIAYLEGRLAVRLNHHSNLYLYFFCLALIKSRVDGLVALIIPYEWVSRPAFKPVRDYIRQQRWGVAVYRFEAHIFEGVMTTASITVIDKSKTRGRWKYYDITKKGRIKRRKDVAGSKAALDYEKRGKIWATRGLSPGSQKVFTLTESERKQFGLHKTDVVPCVTTLRHVPKSLRVLSRPAFKKHFIDAGEKCWLVRSDLDERSTRVNAYLESVPTEERATVTCATRELWFQFRMPSASSLLFSSGFTRFGPKILINSVNARCVGSVTGIHSGGEIAVRALQAYLLKINFEKRVVGHARLLKKVEIKQLNSVLNSFSRN